MSDPRLAVRTRSDNDSPKAAGSFSSVSILGRVYAFDSLRAISE
jgi:hypothetical protein